jgi:hypothetical protein
VLDCKIIYILLIIENTTGMSHLKIRWSVALAHVFSEAIFVVSQCVQVCRVLVSYHEWNMKEFGNEIKYDLLRDLFYYKQTEVSLEQLHHITSCNLAVIIYIYIIFHAFEMGCVKDWCLFWRIKKCVAEPY